jgi:hypothetical protein
MSPATVSQGQMRDKVILIITVTVCLVVVLAVIAPLITGNPNSDAKADMLANVVSSLIAIVSFSLGSNSSKGP